MAQRRWGHTQHCTDDHVITFGGMGDDNLMCNIDNRKSHGRLHTLGSLSQTKLKELIKQEPEKQYDQEITDTLLWNKIDYTGTAHPCERLQHTSHILNLNDSTKVGGISSGRYQLVLFGRTNPSTSLGDMWLFSFETFKWQRLFPIHSECPPPRYRHCSCLLPNGTIIFYGGISTNNSSNCSLCNFEINKYIGTVKKFSINDCWALHTWKWPMELIKLKTPSNLQSYFSASMCCIKVSIKWLIKCHQVSRTSFLDTDKLIDHNTDDTIPVVILQGGRQCKEEEYKDTIPLYILYINNDIVYWIYIKINFPGPIYSHKLLPLNFFTDDDRQINTIDSHILIIGGDTYNTSFIFHTLSLETFIITPVKLPISSYTLLQTKSLWRLHDCSIIYIDNRTIYILVCGGGCICFFKGSYYSPTFLISIEYTYEGVFNSIIYHYWPFYSSINNSINIKNSSSIITPFKCSICESMFSSRNKLFKHLRDSHSIDSLK